MGEKGGEEFGGVPGVAGLRDGFGGQGVGGGGHPVRLRCRFGVWCVLERLGGELGSPALRSPRLLGARLGAGSVPTVGLTPGWLCQDGAGGHHRAPPAAPCPKSSLARRFWGQDAPWVRRMGTRTQI